MRKLWQNSAVVAILAASLAGCASNGDRLAASADASTATHSTPTDLAPGEQIDYAGHRCGNPNVYVKMHLCLFPRR